MRLVWLPVLASSILALTLVQGRASGGLQCTAEDDFAVVTIESGVTRGMGGPVFNFRATSVIRDEKVAGDLQVVPPLSSVIEAAALAWRSADRAARLQAQLQDKTRRRDVLVK